MAVERQRLEADRLANLARAFGWDLVEQIFSDEGITMKYSMPYEEQKKETAKIMVDRLIATASTMGFSEKETSWLGNQVIVTLFKPAS